MIKPTVGRIMWYWPSRHLRKMQPWAAIVTHVWDDNMVNLAVFGIDGTLSPASSVPVVQDGSPWMVGDSPYCEWMPYQKGQAAKVEALEAQQKLAAKEAKEPSALELGAEARKQGAGSY